MKKITLTFSICICLCLFSCLNKEPNKKIEERILEENTIEEKQSDTTYNFEEEVYIPIYSDIYNDSRDSRIQLTATLSIRNISKTDSLFIEKVDYYNTRGELVRNYIDNTIFLRPLETIDYVIDRDDESGGSGANFLVSWKAKKDISPLFQAVMIGISGQQGFSFTTEGIKVVN